MVDIKETEASKQRERLNSYSVSYRCVNCGVGYPQRIEKGKQALDNSTCPRCGCFTGIKRSFK